MRRYSNRNRKNSRISKKHLRKTARKSIKKLFKGGDDKDLKQIINELEKAKKKLTDHRNSNTKFATEYAMRQIHIDTLREEIEELLQEKNAELKNLIKKQNDEEERHNLFMREQDELSDKVDKLVKELEKFK